MKRTEIMMAGFGGQGIVLAGYIIGKAASVYDKKEAVQTQSYGPEARGGACSANVVIDENVIDYPLVSNVEYLILMSQEAYTTYGKRLARDGVMIIDEDLVHLSEEDKMGKVYLIPATRMAEELGKRIVSNIVMLGFFTAVTRLIHYEAMKKSVLDSIPKGTEELNTKAFEKGYQFGLKGKTPDEG